jgi:hypothetical protein
MIKPMPKLAAFFDRTLAPRTAVVSVMFQFRDRRAAAARDGDGLRGKVALYFWPAQCVRNRPCHRIPGG